ncbi:CDF family Co(II)/Ni(II) efflux transporter DmeF [Ottowia testudinis]|uniref:CDF family Co(II)/Ni(II) efflux transporter DmeF n=1 Tax=Ottowia testudinis TaxID=2816950 RepID=A0A975H2M5_9BURK|nr:CDF family Co(II)/Ni(II) efflux transporter DmeF [Ottowia testudinis]QTD44356.1 CDF family Co(II)/Ni(II) efflux transporter DmeF [Ottowia testudinis]
MNAQTTLPACPHRHEFHTSSPLAEQRTRWALALTALTMVAEILGGTVFGSMALLADGWHMGTHALALGLAAAAYWAVRRYAQDARFAFGAWKIEVLAAYTSALLLAGVALAMVVESVDRLLHPVEIEFASAIAVAVVGLAVNLLCLWLLHGAGGHEHGHEHGHAHAYEHGHVPHQHQEHEHAHAHAHAQGDAAADLNLRSAVVHVATDAATSVLALLALLGGLWWGLGWLDPVMGLAGAALIALWAWGLLRETTRTLLDVTMQDPVVDTIRAAVHDVAPTAQLRDLHVWRVGAGRYACLVSIAQAPPAAAQALRQRIGRIPSVVHLTLEDWPTHAVDETPYTPTLSAGELP